MLAVLPTQCFLVEVLAETPVVLMIVVDEDREYLKSTIFKVGSLAASQLTRGRSVFDA